MAFLGNLINELSHDGNHREQQEQLLYGDNYEQQQQQQQQNHHYNQQDYHYNDHEQRSNRGSNINDEVPQVLPPWHASWEEHSQRWLYTNEETGFRTYEPQLHQLNTNTDFPNDDANRDSYCYNNDGQRDDYYSSGESYKRQSFPLAEQYREGNDVGYKNNHLTHGAMGGVVAVGLAGGVLLLDEGERAEEAWRADELYRAEDQIQREKYRVDEDVDSFPQDVLDGFHRFGGTIENVPERVGHGVGYGVGNVERWGDDFGRVDERVGEAFGQGRYEGRYYGGDGCW